MAQRTGLEPQRFLRPPFTVADGAQICLDASGLRLVTIIAGAGATVTVSRVDAPDASAHTTGTQNSFTVAADTRTATTIDWPFYLISVAGGPCRVASV